MATCLILVASLVPTVAVGAEENAQGFIYQGRFADTTTGLAIPDGNYNLDFKIYDSTKACLLFHQLHTAVPVDKGFFSVKVGASQADPTRVGASDPGLRMADVFANSRTIPVTGCGNVTFGAGDKRVMVVQNVTLGTTLPDQEIQGSPSALVAESLQGLRPEQFLMMTSTTLPGAANSGTYGIEAGDVKYHDGVSWSGSSQVLNPSALKGAGATANQVLKWNGTAWAPAADADGFTTGTPGGDISGTFSTMNVAQLQGKTLTIGATPATGDVLTWNGSAFVNSPAAGASGAAGGDLSGTYPNPGVAKIQGFPVSSSSPGSGQYLQWNGSNWVANTVTSITPGGAAGGDLGGTYPNPDVLKIKGSAISATVPSLATQVLRWDPSGAGAWTPMTIDDLIASSGNTMYLRKSGDTMVGNFVLNGNQTFDAGRVIAMTSGTVSGVAKLSGLGDPTATNDAVNKQYADMYVAGATLAGGSLNAGESLRWNAGGYWEKFVSGLGAGTVLHVGSGSGLPDYQFGANSLHDEWGKCDSIFGTS